MASQARPVPPDSGSAAPTPIELRHLRYFLAVCEELNFTRAARRVHVVQQTLSEGIAQLEDMLGLRLFERTTRPVRLTDAAVRWLPHAREVLEAAERAQTAVGQLRSRRAARLSVGLAATAAFPLTPTLLDTFRRRHPQIALSTRHFDFGDPVGGLLTGETDVAIVRPPFRADGLELLMIASEPRYVALADRHPLARRASISFTEIEQEPWIEIDEADPVWCDFWRLTALRRRPPRVGATGHNLDDLLEAARTGQAVGVVAESVAHAQSWPHIAFVEVHDIPPSNVAVAWRAGDNPPPVNQFIAVVREITGC
ncbi:LysR family transcriptional regulator [Dactylosporangium sp. NPDC051541]|uniref:LysR family transcriptional regulator n=1 Tax=Dactylosporangium sp. NPDC051541 TaxID=3363977 RepID=UPI0037B8CDCE